MGKIPDDHNVRPASAKYWYGGSLRLHKISGITLKAYRSWLDQRTRCYNKKSSAYKWYGAKGIKVIYSSREYVGWFIENILTNGIKNPVCGRIDHNKNYEFENIEIQSKSDNAKEVWKRCGEPKVKEKKIIVIHKKTNSIICIAESLKKASELTGVCRQNISRNLTSRPYQVSKGYQFHYYYLWNELK